jgi:formylglycine-generating enzyme required for sulfatase activity
MAGNVWEWCEDWLRADLGAAPVTDPVESSPGLYRMMRGGALDYPAQDSRAAARAVHDRPESRRFFAGGRCVRTL